MLLFYYKCLQTLIFHINKNDANNTRRLLSKSLVAIKFVIVFLIIVFILIILILIVFILVVFIFVIVHKNHPAFKCIICTLRGDYSLYKAYKFNIFFAFFAVKFKMFSVVVPLISAILSAVYFIIPEWQSFPRYGSGAR